MDFAIFHFQFPFDDVFFLIIVHPTHQPFQGSPSQSSARAGLSGLTAYHFPSARVVMP